MNFWGLPSFSLTGNQTIMEICSDIQIGIQYDSTVPSFAFNVTEVSNTSLSGVTYLPAVMTAYWINFNIRVYYGQYILFNGWQGNNWTEIGPDMKILL